MEKQVNEKTNEQKAFKKIRSKTDKSLINERLNMDEYKDDKSVVEKESDDAIRLNRLAADLSCAEKRAKVDLETTKENIQNPELENKKLIDERKRSDKAQIAAREKLDCILERERSQKRLIPEVILETERRNTDSNLLSERATSDTALEQRSTMLAKVKKKQLLEIQKAHSDEQSRISLNLHDSLGQALIVLKMEFYDLKNNLPEISLINRKKMSEIENSIDQIIKLVRKVAFELHPAIIKDLGLEEAIKQMVKGLKLSSGRDIRAEISLDGHNVDPASAKAIFRISQEALSNSLKHSNSKKIDIKLWKTNSGFILTVRDYNKAKVISYQSEENSLGLIGIKERVNKLGGSLSMKSDGGTILRVEIPEKRLT